MLRPTRAAWCDRRRDHDRQRSRRDHAGGGAAVRSREVYADSAYAADRFTNVIRARGGVPRVVYTSTWGGPAALARLEAWNAEVRRVRCRIEKVFGTWKRSYGLRRMRWLGLAKAGLQVRLTAIAYNLDPGRNSAMTSPTSNARAYGRRRRKRCPSTPSA